MATVAARLLTADEFYELPEPADGSKLELVKGRIVTMTAPGFEDGVIQTNIAAILWNFAKSKKLGTVLTESGVVTQRKSDTVRGPDVSYYSKKRAPLGKRIIKYNDQPPDLCVEIVSPSNTRKELRKKLKEYFTAGVRMVWLIEPEDRSVTVLTNADQGKTLYEDAELNGGDVLPGFSCKVCELFE